MKIKKVHTKVMANHKNSVGRNNFSREKWVAEVLRLASFKYNLEDEDFEIYLKKINRRKTK